MGFQCLQVVLTHRETDELFQCTLRTVLIPEMKKGLATRDCYGRLSTTVMA
jgi:hypothetical protein